MIGLTMSGDTKPSPRTVGRFLEFFTIGFFGVALLLLSYDRWYAFLTVIVALLFGVGAYYCARQAQAEKSKVSVDEKPSEINERYLIKVRNLEKMSADGVPWDVVGALARLIDRPPSLPGKPADMTEVELIQQLVSLECDLERINEFRKKILKNTKVENTIVPRNPSNGTSPGSEHAARAQTLEPSNAVRVP